MTCIHTKRDNNCIHIFTLGDILKKEQQKLKICSENVKTVFSVTRWVMWFKISIHEGVSQTFASGDMLKCLTKTLEAVFKKDRNGAPEQIHKSFETTFDILKWKHRQLCLNKTQREFQKARAGACKVCIWWSCTCPCEWCHQKPSPIFFCLSLFILMDCVVLIIELFFYWGQSCPIMQSAINWLYSHWTFHFA